MQQDLKTGWDFFDSPDARIKIRILRAVDKSLDSMKVSDICEKAGISRRTFYRHFDNKYEIPDWFFSYCGRFYLDDIGRSIGWRTGYYHHLRLISQERDVLRKALQYSINEPFVSTVGTETRTQVILETLRNYRGVTVTSNLEFLAKTFARVEREVINEWMRSDRPTDLMRWTEDLVSIVPPKLFEAMEIEGSEDIDTFLAANGSSFVRIK